MRIITLMAMAITVIGCSTDYKAKVESDTSWSGAFGDRSVDGSGNKTIDIPDDPPVCVVVQKDTEKGSLSVQIIAEGGGIFGADDGDPVKTTADYGVVSACSK